MEEDTTESLPQGGETSYVFPFDRLPPELLVAVFFQLDVGQICMCLPLVCKKWAALSQDAALWRPICLRFGYWEPDTTNQPQDWKAHFKDFSEFKFGIEKKELIFGHKIGEGAHSKVFLGKYRGHPVALKVQKKKEWSISDLRAIQSRFRSIAKMRHQNVLHLYGICASPVTRDPPKILLSESEKGEFNIIIVTELCHRGSLSHLLDSLPGQQPDPIEALRTAQWSLFRIAGDIVRGVQYLHTWKPKRAWLVGAHLCTDTVLLDRYLNAKVQAYFNDFFVGVEYAELEEGNIEGGYEEDALVLQHLDRGKGVLRGVYGQLASASPEVFFGKRETEKSDSYSIAFILWEIVALLANGSYSRPYSEFALRFDFDILQKAAKSNLRPTIPSSVPSLLQSLISSCWAQVPENRPSLDQIALTIAQAQHETLQMVL